MNRKDLTKVCTTVEDGPKLKLLFGIQSVNSQAIVTKFCNHCYLVIWQQP